MGIRCRLAANFMYEIGEKGLKVSTGANQHRSVKVSIWSPFLGIWGLSNKLLISLRNARTSEPNENKSGFR